MCHQLLRDAVIIESNIFNTLALAMVTCKVSKLTATAKHCALHSFARQRKHLRHLLKALS